MLLVAVLAACETQAPAATGPGSPPATPGPRSSSAATPGAGSPPPATLDTLRVAYVQDLSPDDANDTTQPPLQALELAFATAPPGRLPAPVEVVSFDVRGDPTATDEIAAEIASDPSYLAVVAAPNLGGLRGLGAVLGRAGVPLLSLSARDGVEGAMPGTWFRFVAPLRIQAEALAAGVASMRRALGGVCVVTGPSDGTRLGRVVRRELAARLAIIDARTAADVSAAECGIAVWTGNGLDGAALALRLEETATPGPVVAGGSGLREPDFLREAGVAAEGAVSFCSCADLSTSLRLRAQRFIQDYQSEFGRSPGPFAVEAWDAARMLIVALPPDDPSRGGLTASLAATTEFRGLGGSYRFVGGELVDPWAAVRRYRVEGGRWITNAPGGR